MDTTLSLPSTAEKDRKKLNDNDKTITMVTGKITMLCLSANLKWPVLNGSQIFFNLAHLLLVSSSTMATPA